MDKEIIIDGVDVSGCPFYEYQTEEDYEMRYPESGYCEIGLAGYLFNYSRITEEIEKDCIDNHNCFFKQLQRAKAENKELERKYADVLKLAKENADSNEYCLQELEKENEQLKKSIDRIMQNKEIKTIDSEIALLNAELQQENKRLKARLRPLEDSYFNGLSSIEIAELAKKSIRITAENRKFEDALQEIKDIVSEPCIVDENCQTCKSNCMQKDILTKINEVIGAE